MNVLKIFDSNEKLRLQLSFFNAKLIRSFKTFKLPFTKVSFLVQNT